MKAKLTERQQQIYDYIVAYTVEHIYPPSVREICRHSGLKSTSSVWSQLDALVSKGYITCQRDTPRGITLIDYEVVRKALD